NRNQALAGKPEAAELVKASEGVVTKAFDLEKRLHNPTAEVTYDILAMRGGAMLYSRLAPLVMWASEGVGAPTASMREVFAAQKAELDALAAEVRALMGGPVADLNRQAAALGLGYVIPK
ncbi:MAG: glycosyl hydrolase, partial [Gemmatimonadetes bacterium]|nr:glycosyl hydrolase [Gemmatimonadota bacterium]